MGKGVYNRQGDLKKEWKDFTMRGWGAQKRRRKSRLDFKHICSQHPHNQLQVSRQMSQVNKPIFRLET